MLRTPVLAAPDAPQVSARRTRAPARSSVPVTSDSGTLGYDAIDGGTPDPVSSTPKDLPVGKYAYFCRIHPFMRGEFRVIP